jgi:hypothetical protein
MARINEKDWQLALRAMDAQVASGMSQQQQMIRLIQYLNIGDMDKAAAVLSRGLPVDLMLRREEDGGTPGANALFAPIESTLGRRVEWLTPLVLFAQADLTEQVAWLLAQNAMPNMVIDGGFDAAWVAMVAGGLDSYDILMEAGADPGQRLTDGSKTTRLMAATVLRQVSVVSDLLSRDVDTNAWDAKGQLALHINLRQNPYEDTDLEITRLLLNSQSVPEWDDNSGVSPLDLLTSPAHVALLRASRSLQMGPVAPEPQPKVVPTGPTVEPEAPAPTAPVPRPPRQRQRP